MAIKDLRGTKFLVTGAASGIGRALAIGLRDKDCHLALVDIDEGGLTRVQLELNGSATVQAVLDALESKYPMLRGTIRDHGTQKRRPMVRFFVCGEDVSHDLVDKALPEAIGKGEEPFFIIGAIAGG